MKMRRKLHAAMQTLVLRGCLPTNRSGSMAQVLLHNVCNYYLYLFHNSMKIPVCQPSGIFCYFIIIVLCTIQTERSGC